MKIVIYTLIAIILSTTSTHGADAFDGTKENSLSDLKNYQVNSPKMVSSGLPNQTQFEALKKIGVTKVIDLIPGDRGEEADLMKSLDLSYYNVQVDWENPTIENFQDYVLSMQQSKGSEGMTLTHCRLNWRGAVFTYLYRVTVLKESAALAKQDMLAIWQPNEVWQDFIDKVLRLRN
jgi:hypothetical protein